jgi:hypothetical protein
VLAYIWNHQYDGRHRPEARHYDAFTQGRLNKFDDVMVPDDAIDLDDVCLDDAISARFECGTRDDVGSASVLQKQHPSSFVIWLGGGEGRAQLYFECVKGSAREPCFYQYLLCFITPDRTLI